MFDKEYGSCEILRNRGGLWAGKLNTRGKDGAAPSECAP